MHTPSLKHRSTSTARSSRAPWTILLATRAILAMLGVLGIAGMCRADDKDELAALWNDPTFQKQFVGTYGINAEIEPRVTPDEVKLLESVRPLMADDLPGAEALLIKKMKPDGSAMLDFTLGSIQFQQDRMPDALANYTKAVEKFPSFRRAWRNLGLIHARDGRNDEAITAFTKMIELGGGDGYSYGLLGSVYAAKQDYQAAEAAYRNALLLQPESTDWRLGLTTCAFRQKKYEDAATLLDVLIVRYPDNAKFWLLQANTYLGMKEPFKAAQNLESLDILGKSTVDSLNMLGDIYVSENLMDLAVDAYLRAIDLDPEQSVARSMRSAEALAVRGALPQAWLVAARMRSVWEARLDDAERGRLLKLEARISMADGPGSAETAKVLEEILALDPLDGEVLMLLGQHYSSANEPDRSMFYYERAESLEKFEVKARIYHARVLVGLGRYADAVPLLRRAQELKPSEDVARYLEQVERIAKARR